MASVIISDRKTVEYTNPNQRQIIVAIIDADNYFFAHQYGSNIYTYNFPTNTYTLYTGVSFAIMGLEYIDGYLYVISSSSSYAVYKDQQAVKTGTVSSILDIHHTYHIGNDRIYVVKTFTNTSMYLTINQSTHALTAGGGITGLLTNRPYKYGDYHFSGGYKNSSSSSFYTGGIYRTGSTVPFGNSTLAVSNENLSGGFSFVLDDILIQSRTGYSYNLTNNTTAMLDVYTTRYDTYFGDCNQTLKIAVVGEYMSTTEIRFTKWQSLEYDITYTIKDKTGEETYVTSEHNSPISKVRFNYSGSTVSYVFTTSSGVKTGTYTPTLPEESTLAGFSRSPNSTIVEFGLNTDVSIYLEENTTFYEVYKKYVPPATTFAMNLYTNSADRLVLDKESFLTSVGTLNGALRERCDIVTPKIIIEYATLLDFNYVQIPIWSRYYYVTDVVSVRKNLWEISLLLDERYSYKNEILALKDVIIARAESAVLYNPYLADDMIPAERGTTRTVTEISNTSLSATESSYPFVVAVVAKSN